jgi:NADPH2:quinone reductase
MSAVENSIRIMEMRAMRVHSPGGVDAIVEDRIDRMAPGAGEALVRVEFAGVNFIDVYKRSGAYKVPMPLTLGEEGAGVVESVGAGVTDVRPGDRVAWASVPGSYADYAVVKAARLVPVPREVDSRAAAAVMLQGMTAHYLATSLYPLERGDRCLVHAAAGGVGLLLVQIAKRRGAFVIGTAGSEAKAALARQAGADEMIVYTSHDFVAETKRITESSGVQVVYDSVGKTTFLAGLDVLAPRGMMALFGQSSGPVAPIDPQLLNQKGSLFLTRPTLAHYTATRDELLRRAWELFEWIGRGELSVRIGGEYALAEAGQAHRDLESRKTSGKLVLRT